MKRLFANLLAKHWHYFNKEDSKKRVWKRLTDEFKAAIPAELAARVTENTLPNKLHNERQVIRAER